MRTLEAPNCDRIVRTMPLAVLALAAALVLTATPAPAQEIEPEVLLEQARYEEQVRGDLDAAIRIYRSLVEEHPEDRNVAARALLEMGRAYETLGREDARQAYRRVVREYGDQVEAAEAARARLGVLGEADPAPEPRSGELRMRRLWAADVDLSVGSLSPGADRVLFIDWGSIDDAALRGHADVAIYDMADDAFRLVTDRPSLNELDVYPAVPTWSRDGRRIAYQSWHPGWTHQQIRVARADGSADRAVLDNEQMGEARPMAFSSGGDFVVALLRGWDDAYRIGIVSTGDGELTVLKTLGLARPGALSISPDDRFVAYDRPADDGPERDIFVLSVDGAVEMPVAPHPGNDARAFWTPDGARIVFMSERSGETGLWAVDWRGDAPAGDPELVQTHLSGMELLGLSASGAPYFERRNLRSEVRVAPVELTGSGSMGEPTTLPETGLLTNFRPAWSPDGERVAWLSLRGPGGGSPHLVVREMAGGEEVAHPLPFPTGDFRSIRPDWSRDGDHLWVEGGDEDPDGPSRVSYRIHARTGEVSRMAHLRDFAGASLGGITEFHFVDGRQAEGLRSLGVRLAGQTDHFLASEGDFELGPGERLVRVRNGVHEIPDAHLLSSGGVPTDARALVPAATHSPVEWRLSPDGRTLAVAAPEPGSGIANVLWAVPLDRGDPVELDRLPPGPADEGGLRHLEAVRWSHEGTHVLYAIQETGRDEDSGPVQIRIVAAAGGTPRTLELPLTPYELGNASFHPDGRRITYSRMDPQNELWLAEGLPWQVARSR